MHIFKIRENKMTLISLATGGCQASCLCDRGLSWGEIKDEYCEITNNVTINSEQVYGPSNHRSDT